MPWYCPSLFLSERINKRVCIYLLQRYLGQFLEKKLTSDQLSVDLYEGKGTIENVSLDVQALNELGEKQNLPLEFVSGFIGQIAVSIPWSSILRDSTNIEVRGLKLTVQPKQRVESATSMFESMWSSMTNSFQLAEECLKQDAEIADTSQPLEGIEVCAQTIDSILSRIKVKFVDTTFCFELCSKNGLTGIALILTIDSIQYTDESGDDPPPNESTEQTEQNKSYVVSSVTTKNLTFEGIAFSTQEFQTPSRTEEPDVHFQYAQEEGKILSEAIPLEAHKFDYLEYDDNRLIFAKIIGKQVIRIRFKQAEDVSGPKVSIDMSFGAVNAFLSPRQLHNIVEIVNGLFAKVNEDLSKAVSKQKCTEKPMVGVDYQRVEQELQCQLNPGLLTLPGLQGTRGWSTAQLEESDTDDNFFPIRSRDVDGGMADSTYSNASSSMESSLSSSMASISSEATSHRTRRKFNSIESDPTAEISHFHIRIASFVILLLHEDILSFNNDTVFELVPSSVKQLKLCTEQFFTAMSNFVLPGYGARNFDDSKHIFEKACNRRHMRLLAAPIQIECHETTTSSAFAITGEMTSAKLELLEVFVKDVSKFDYVRLLYFKDDQPRCSPMHSKPCLKMGFKHIEKTSRTGTTRKGYIPKTDVNFILDTCVLDIDITIIDRLSALLNPASIFQCKQNVTPNLSKADKQATCVESIVDIKLSSNSMELKLRIPIPDFRPPNDLQRVPWWERNVRNSFITANMSHVQAHTLMQTNQESQIYNIQCKTLDLYYHENETATPLHIGTSSIDKRFTSGNNPSVTITINPVAKVGLDSANIEPDGDMTMSCGTIMPPARKGPFSSKRVIHESDTPHARTQTEEDAAELVLPGTKSEMSDFIEKATQLTRIHLDFNFPTASVQFISKHIFEVLYNHILSDLLLWEPSAPVSKAQENPRSNPQMFESFSGPDTYASCKSGNKYESDSDESEEFDPQNSNLFYSAYDMRNRTVRKQQVKRKAQSYLTLNVHIRKGLIRMNPPVRDVDSNVIPEQIGEFVLVVEEASIFSVTGYNGDENLGYVCIQSKDAQLHHSDILSTTSHCNQLKDVGAALGRHLFPTIYKSEQGILATCKDRGGDRDMLSVAIRIQANHETHHVKLVRVALGLNKATLRHRMCSVPNMWITQLIDFFKVNDYTIPGFHAKDVLTEMHLHLWDCGIDYRPINLPLRSVLTLGSLSMSSHLTTTANTTTLRFLAEDCNLFLSDRTSQKKGNPSTTAVDLRREYVGIIDIGLVEISLKINEISFPNCDLRALINKFMIHTCADSARALMELITYVATNGDLNDEQQSNANLRKYSSPKRQVEQNLINVETQDISNLSKSQHQEVNEMLVDAMKESVAVSRDAQVHLPGAKLFFFPDEGQLIPENVKPFHQVTTELGDVTFLSNRSSDTDEEFYIVENETGLGIMPKNGLPQIRWLIDGPLRLVDNHFTIPVGKTDVLKAPKDFPTPVMRYTLCEMTVQWKLYAGNDFHTIETMEKKSVNFSDVSLHNSIGYSNRNTGEIYFHSKPKRKSKCNWILHGGINRNHDIVLDVQLNKVRVQHDIYPEYTMQASRQVIVVSQIEIRDRLISSRINKLLYLDSTELRPRQTHAHMLTIKLIHIRPDLKIKAEECILKIGLLPLRINLDQDTLFFILNFATEMTIENTNTSLEDTKSASKHNTPTHPPVMTITREQEIDDVEAQKLVDENLIILLDDVKDKVESANVEKAIHAVTSTGDNSPPVYFRKVIFMNPVPIRLDYHSKGNFEWKHGPIAALIIGIASLNYVEFTLKRLVNNHGILGFDKLIQYFVQEWKNDIKRNQYHTVLSGVGPMHSLVQLFQGVRDLIWMPIEQYQKDGRIVRGFQRGANSFTTSTAMAALELTNRFINLIQLTAETAYDMMSPGPSVRRAIEIKTKGRKKRYNQPQDIRQGVSNAYNVVKEGLGETAENIVRVASIENEQKGITGAVGGVLRQIPTTILVKPIIIASEATSNVLGGMQCQLLPDAKREANEKWKNDDEYI